MNIVLFVSLNKIHATKCMQVYRNSFSFPSYLSFLSFVSNIEHEILSWKFSVTDCFPWSLDMEWSVTKENIWNLVWMMIHNGQLAWQTAKIQNCQTCLKQRQLIVTVVGGRLRYFIISLCHWTINKSYYLLRSSGGYLFLGSLVSVSFLFLCSRRRRCSM